ncbi:MAG: hypothetical protein P4M10_03540, partial [Verrucomicrobiae bacterium]|nr:hypothetical protein [Verrucomicrobiae bacterium]
MQRLSNLFRTNRARGQIRLPVPCGSDVYGSLAGKLMLPPGNAGGQAGDQQGKHGNDGINFDEAARGRSFAPGFL